MRAYTCIPRVSCVYTCVLLRPFPITIRRASVRLSNTGICLSMHVHDVYERPLATKIAAANEANGAWSE